MLRCQNVSATGGSNASEAVSQVAYYMTENAPTPLVRRPGRQFFSSLCPSYRSKTHLYTRERFLKLGARRMEIRRASGV